MNNHNGPPSSYAKAALCLMLLHGLLALLYVVIFFSLSGAIRINTAEFLFLQVMPTQTAAVVVAYIYLAVKDYRLCTKDLRWCTKEKYKS